jgi:hypothetical protein
MDEANVRKLDNDFAAVTFAFSKWRGVSADDSQLDMRATAAPPRSMLDSMKGKMRGENCRLRGGRAPIYGTVKWLFQEYRRSKAYTEKVSPRSRPDYERTMLLVENIVTKKGDKLGDRRIKAITPIGVDKVYEIIMAARTVEWPAEKAGALCRRAWRVVHRLYPREFDRDVPNPWDGVTIQRRKNQKALSTLSHGRTAMNAEL